MQILKCVSHIDHFDVELFNELKIGLEIQDFMRPTLPLEEVERRIIGYQEKLDSFKHIKAMHGPFLDLKPVSPNPLIQEVSEQRYLDALRIAKTLSIDTLILHSQINPWLNIHDAKWYHEAYRRFFERLFNEVDYKGLIVLENIFENDPYQLKALIEGIQLDQVKVNLDIGHAQIKNQTRLEEWFQVLGEHIRYIHLHSNDGNNDLHDPLTVEQLEEVKSYMIKYTENPQVAIEYDLTSLNQEMRFIQSILKIK